MVSVWCLCYTSSRVWGAPGGVVDVGRVIFGKPVRFIVRVLFALAFFGVSVSQAQAPPATPPAKLAPPDPEAGKALFQQNCVNCHGLDATGEEGPNLHGVPAALGDTAVANIIRRGIPGTGMPSSYTITEQDAANIVGWLRSLDSAPTAAAVGDPKKGEAVYASSGCSACHMINGEGGNIGPDLSRIGMQRGPANLKARLTDPAANLPKPVGGFTGGGGFTQYIMFRAVEKDGHATEGMRVGEDSFSIVLKDAQGKLHGFRKPDLAKLEKLPGKSFMPSFKDALSAAQMDDVIAYLSTLKAAQ
ncbi:MAG TPA: c-type cytochrome [Burkholderiales bacterium]|nr:c-type cytochrome [Burkholderiales bacterium]